MGVYLCSHLNYYNARYYDAQVSRFITADLIVDGEFDTQGWNRYAYVKGNPVKYIDPLGFWGAYVSYGADAGYGAGEDEAAYGGYSGTAYVDDEGKTGVTSGTEASKDGWGFALQLGVSVGFVGGDTNKRLNTGYKRVTVVLGVSLTEHFDERGNPTGFGFGLGDIGIGQFIVYPDQTLVEGEVDIEEAISE